MTDRADGSGGPPMPELTVELLRSLAEAQGLVLTEEDVAAILPLVRMGRGPLASAPEVPREAEPAVEFRVEP
jgi:hypothetical protein